MSRRRAPSLTRLRTLGHMHGMLAAAMAAAGCAQPKTATTATTVTLSPPDTGASSAGAATSARPDAGASSPAVDASVATNTSPTATASATVLPVQAHVQQGPFVQHPMMGSDPVPPPASCVLLGTNAKVAASLVRDAAGVVLELSVTIPSHDPSHATFFPLAKVQSPGQQPFVWGGKVVSAKVAGSSAVVRILPDGTQRGGLHVAFMLSCAGGRSGTLDVGVQFATPATPGAAVTAKAWAH